MLATTDLAISEVASGCGFASASHFAAAFARATATTPTGYRDAARKVSHLMRTATYA